MGTEKPRPAPGAVRRKETRCATAGACRGSRGRGWAPLRPSKLRAAAVAGRRRPCPYPPRRRKRPQLGAGPRPRPPAPPPRACPPRRESRRTCLGGAGAAPLQPLVAPGGRRTLRARAPRGRRWARSRLLTPSPPRPATPSAGRGGPEARDFPRESPPRALAAYSARGRDCERMRPPCTCGDSRRRAGRMRVTPRLTLASQNPPGITPLQGPLTPAGVAIQSLPTERPLKCRRHPRGPNTPKTRPYRTWRSSGER